MYYFTVTSCLLIRPINTVCSLADGTRLDYRCLSVRMCDSFHVCFFYFSRPGVYEVQQLSGGARHVAVLTGKSGVYICNFPFFLRLFPPI